MAFRELNHRLQNIQGVIESCINRLKNADDNSKRKRWSMMREVLLVSGRDRIDREMTAYSKKRDAIESISCKISRDIYDTFIIADKNYKSLFDLVHNATTYSIEGKDASVSIGKVITDALLHIIEKLEAVQNDTENPDR